jgi:hypothetical protein
VLAGMVWLMNFTEWRTRSLLDAELVAFRVGHDDMFGARFLDLLEKDGAQLSEPGGLGVSVVRTGVQIEVQAVLGRAGAQQPVIPAMPGRGCAS